MLEGLPCNVYSSMSLGLYCCAACEQSCNLRHGNILGTHLPHIVEYIVSLTCRLHEENSTFNKKKNRNNN